MPAEFDPRTTIVLITYNSAAYLRDCIGSLLEAAPGVPILVVDNASGDDTLRILRDDYPMCEVVALGENVGHSAACNLALQRARTPWVLLLDHDTAVPPGWLEPLLDAARGRWPDVGMVSSRAVFDRDGRIHHDGGFAHYVGHMTLHHGGALPAEHPAGEPFEVGAQAATSLLVHRGRALEAGGFDEDFFIYLNDFELTLRMRMLGWPSFVAPRSVVLHRQGNPETSWRGSGSYPARRAFLIYRNRWMLLLKIYRLRTLLVCAPMILFYEAILLAAALGRGWLGAYAAALRDVARRWPALMRQRRQIQASRTVGDRQLLSARGLSFVPGLVKGPARLAQRAVEALLSGYWRLVQPLLG